VTLSAPLQLPKESTAIQTKVSKYTDQINTFLKGGLHGLEHIGRNRADGTPNCKPEQCPGTFLFVFGKSKNFAACGKPVMLKP